MKPIPKDIMLAHQYLYYVLGEPAISDYEYDMFCKLHNLDGGGGSDRKEDYSQEIINLAKTL